MKYINTFKTYASYEEKLNVGGVDISLPNVSYCKDIKDAHYNPYNTVEFYVGEITEPQTVSIYTDSSTSVPIQVSKGNKWYSYLLPKGKGLFKIVGDSVKKVVVKADIVTEAAETIIPISTVEASFKGSNTSKVTNMTSMFDGCRSLTSLDLSSFDTSNVTDMRYMFYGCSGLTSLDLSGWNISNVYLMNGMFQNCSKLTSLNLSSFDTSKVTNMSIMFFGCGGLTSLDLSGWVINDATSVMDMFYDCDSLTTIRMVGCSRDTIGKINSVKPSTATIVTE